MVYTGTGGTDMNEAGGNGCLVHANVQVHISKYICMFLNNFSLIFNAQYFFFSHICIYICILIEEEQYRHRH